MSTCERDIVYRLRNFAALPQGDRVCNNEAADEIERLRAELADVWRKSAQALVELSSNLCATSARERERIVAERDEARREVCSLTANWKHERFDVAKARGWDCFNEENTND